MMFKQINDDGPEVAVCSVRNKGSADMLPGHAAFWAYRIADDDTRNDGYAVTNGWSAGDLPNPLLIAGACMGRVIPIDSPGLIQTYGPITLKVSGYATAPFAGAAAGASWNDASLANLFLFPLAGMVASNNGYWGIFTIPDSTVVDGRQMRMMKCAVPVAKPAAGNMTAGDTSTIKAFIRTL